GFSGSISLILAKRGTWTAKVAKNSVLLTQQHMTVQNRKASIAFRSLIRKEILPLDRDSKKDLETHKIIDLLADREAESVRQWLTAHPEVDVVSRDRGKTYIEGATSGAPQATQVTDRWHILSNLGDAVEEFLIRAQLRLEEGKAEAG